MIKTFAQLKRDLKVGTKLLQIENDFKEVNTNIRTISKVQSNAIAIKTSKNNKVVDSFIWFPKKVKDVIYKGDTFYFYDDYGLGLKIGYKIL